MTTALFFLGGLGAVAALLLGVASRVFYVKENPLIGEVENALPGANCGGCGFAGCRACAEAIVAGKAEANACVVGGFETAVEVGAVMGVKVEAREPDLASTTCTYGTDRADMIYRYNGAQDCRAAVALFGGSKLCPVGCIGLGSCVKACQFDALTIGADALPQFNPNNCVGCGACAETCPKGIISLTSSTRRVVDEYRSTECTAPCQRACPTGIQIPAYIHEIREGRFAEALRIIKERCPLPLICGRICPAPCEFDCRRNLAGDQPVGINPLKRFAADYEMRTGEHINPYKNAPSGRSVAVVGAGAEGLTASYYLARLGHETTLIDAQPQLGGILRYVIAPGRLPGEALDHEIKSIQEMGVTPRTATVLGRDCTISSLIEGEGFAAVLLATGGFDSRKILKPGSGREQLVPDVHLMLDFLEDANLEVGKRALIVGGPTRAREVATLCRQRGARQVTIVAPASAANLPQELGERSELSAENISVLTETVVVALFGRGDRLVGAMLEERAADGSFSATQLIDADTLILAGGRIPELVFAPVLTGAEDEDREAVLAPLRDLATEPAWKTVPLYRTLPGAGEHGLFASPEPGRTSDASGVVHAILSGRRIVRATQQYLGTGAVAPIDQLALGADEILDVDEISGVAIAPRQGDVDVRREPGTLADWTAGNELSGLSETEAKLEAERCLQCGLICYTKAQ